MKRIVSLFLAFVFLLTPTLAAGVSPSSAPLTSSGLTSLPKLSQAEITQLLVDNPLGVNGEVFTSAPSAAAPYAAGALSDGALNAALGRLNLIRRMAGLNSVTLDRDLTGRAQHGAVLLAANGALSHHPEQPADMDESFYRTGLNAASSSNIYMGTNATLPQAVNAFMNDSDSGNLTSLGHRRWFLNPTMAKTGFGFSPSDHAFGGYSYNFATVWAFDRSGSEDNYDFIAWPASGSFPSTLFGKDQAWSVSLNPAKYAVPVLSELTVTLTHADSEGVWTLRGTESYTAADAGAYLGVNTENYGVANCIIFRPQLDASAYSGRYTVTIDGLRTAAGQAASLAYQVDFFTPGEVAQPVQTPDDNAAASGFLDVSADAWYAEDVAYATENGLFNGVGGNRFDPNGSMTRVMLMTVLARLDGVDTTPVGQETWFIKGHRWAVTNRISDGLDPHRALTLEEVSTMIYNYAKFRYGATAVANFHLATMPDGNDVSSWAADGTNWMVDRGLLQGDQEGKLYPQRLATRAQVAALLRRFLELEQ